MVSHSSWQTRRLLEVRSCWHKQDKIHLGPHYLLLLHCQTPLQSSLHARWTPGQCIAQVSLVMRTTLPRVGILLFGTSQASVAASGHYSRLKDRSRRLPAKPGGPATPTCRSSRNRPATQYPTHLHGREEAEKQVDEGGPRLYAAVGLGASESASLLYIEPRGGREGHCLYEGEGAVCTYLFIYLLVLFFFCNFALLRILHPGKWFLPPLPSPATTLSGGQ